MVTISSFRFRSPRTFTASYFKDDSKKDVAMEVESEVCYKTAADDKLFGESTVTEKIEHCGIQNPVEWKPKPSIRDAYTQVILDLYIDFK